MVAMTGEKPGRLCKAVRPHGSPSRASPSVVNGLGSPYRDAGGDRPPAPGRHPRLQSLYERFAGCCKRRAAQSTRSSSQCRWSRSTTARGSRPADLLHRPITAAESRPAGMDDGPRRRYVGLTNLMGSTLPAAATDCGRSSRSSRTRPALLRRVPRTRPRSPPCPGIRLPQAAATAISTASVAFGIDQALAELEPIAAARRASGTGSPYPLTIDRLVAGSLARHKAWCWRASPRRGGAERDDRGAAMSRAKEAPDSAYRPCVGSCC